MLLFFRRKNCTSMTFTLLIHQTDKLKVPNFLSNKMRPSQETLEFVVILKIRVIYILLDSSRAESEQYWILGASKISFRLRIISTKIEKTITAI